MSEVKRFAATIPKHPHETGCVFHPESEPLVQEHMVRTFGQQQVVLIEYSAYQRLDRALEVAMKGIKSSVVIEHVCVKCGADSEHCYVLMDSKTLLAEIEAILKGDHEDNKD